MDRSLPEIIIRSRHIKLYIRIGIALADQTRNNHTRLGIDILKKEEIGTLQHNLLQRKIESLRIEVDQEHYLLSIGGSSQI